MRLRFCAYDNPMQLGDEPSVKVRLFANFHTSWFDAAEDVPANSLPSVELSGYLTLHDAIAEALAKLDPDGMIIPFFDDRTGSPGAPERQTTAVFARNAECDPSVAMVSDFSDPNVVWTIDRHGRLGFEGRLAFIASQTVFIDEAGNASDAGYNAQDFRDILVCRSDGGFGGDSVWYDMASFLMDHGVLIGVDAAVGLGVGGLVSKVRSRIVGSREDRRARRAAREWEQRGLTQPSILREWIDGKAVWSVSEVSRRLDIADSASAQLLLALGFEPRKGDSATWQTGTSRRASRRRSKWLRSETVSWQPELNVRED